jgi:hypothetical protein
MGIKGRQMASQPASETRQRSRDSRQLMVDSTGLPFHHFNEQPYSENGAFSFPRCSFLVEVFFNRIAGLQAVCGLLGACEPPSDHRKHFGPA